MPISSRQTSVQNWLIAVGVAINFFVLSFSVYIYIKQRAPLPGQIQVEVLASVPRLLALATEDLPVKIVWQERLGLEGPLNVEIDSLNQTLIKISNIGEEPFRWQERVVAPLDLVLGGGGQILRASTFDPLTNNTAIPVRLHLDGTRTKVNIELHVVNPGDSLVLAIIHTGEADGFKLIGMLEGQELPSLQRRVDTTNHSGALFLRVLWWQVAIAIGLSVGFLFGNSTWSGGNRFKLRHFMACVASGSLPALAAVPIAAMLWLNVGSVITHTIISLGLLPVAHFIVSILIERSSMVVVGHGPEVGTKR